jgi:N4-gp56 family major capsid protein
MPFENPHMYNDPAGGTDSDVGGQIRTDFFDRRALIEAAKEQYFGQMASVKNMPKNMGKTIKLFHYLPILDDRNQGDQGIDADGISTSAAHTATTVVSATIEAVPSAGETLYFMGHATGANIATAFANADEVAEGQAEAYMRWLGFTGAAWSNVQTAAEAAGGTFTDLTAGDDTGVNFQNLYGSSKDVGTIQGKIPALSETGGRVNRVGHKRIQLEGSIEKFGFFDEYTQESLDFDTDSELLMHITGECVKAANEITEDQLQIDLLNAAGVIRFAGDATSTATLGGSTAAANAEDVIVYDDLVKLSIELNNNRTPKDTTLITGSRMVDTKVVNASRYAYIGSELEPAIMRMVDYHGERAFLPVAKYGEAGTLARGEFGNVHDFRIISVPEMMHWEATGAAVGDVEDEVCHWGRDDAGAAKVNVFPFLVVGDGSFATIGFQTDGKTVKYTITHKKPGQETADRNDPYGEVGFYSIKWYYGFMTLRSERIAILKSVATF